MDQLALPIAGNKGFQTAGPLPALGQYLVMLDLDWQRPMAPPELHLAVDAMASHRRPHRYSNTFAVLTANSMRGQDYYDLWALRSHLLSIDYDCWFDQQRSTVRGNCDSYEIRIDSSAPIVPVNSSFNGLAIYSVAAMRHHVPQCLYKGEHTCEHVSFHLCLRKRGLQIGIAPFLIQGCGEGAPRCAVGPPLTRVRVEPNGDVHVQRTAAPDGVMHVQRSTARSHLL